MKTIKQGKDYTGCGLACVAMLANKKYKSVKNIAKRKNFKEGKQFITSDRNIVALLNHYKKNCSKSYSNIRINWEELHKNAIIAVKSGQLEINHWRQ